MKEITVPDATFDIVVSGGKLACLSEFGQFLSVQVLPKELAK
ncbi:MAG: hypothetical protein WC712_04975 [Candidatus Brocadiia bacterium]